MDRCERGPRTRRQRNHALILLRADAGETDAEVGVSLGTVANVRRRFAAGGLDAALNEKSQPGAKPVLDSKAEASKKLKGNVAPPVSPSLGTSAKQDYEYTRHGTANLFVIVEPLASRRYVTVTDRRTIPDFAAQMKHLCDEMYPEAEVVRVVLDNLYTLRLGLLFTTYSPDEAWRLARRLEFYFTPKHAIWINMAECDLSVLSRQCLDHRLPSKEAVGAEITP